MKFLITILSIALFLPLAAEPEVEAPTKRAKKEKKKASYLETGGERKLNITYKQAGDRQLLLDLYYPTAKRAETSPLIIYTHGGGWTTGSRFGASRGVFSQVFKKLLAEGFAVASVDYRKYSKGNTIAMRDCVIDAKDAIRYLAKSSDSLKLNRNQFFTFGDSAGGHIAQMLLLSPNDVLVGDEILAETPYQITAGVSWYGPSDFQDINLFNHDDRPRFRDRFGPRILAGGNTSEDDKIQLYREMSPIVYLKKESPPLFMIQGDQDTTIPVKHAYHMEKRAKEIQAPVTTLIIKNSGHNWRKVGSPIEPTKGEIVQSTVNFFVQQMEKTESQR